MVNEKKLKQPYNFFIENPIILSAIITVITFYFFCFVENHISIFLLRIILISCILISLCILLFRFLFKKKYSFIFLSFFIACFSVLRILHLCANPFSLAELDKVETLTAEMTGEAYPAGKNYYAARAKLLSFSYKNGAKFSANGNIKIFFPSEMVLQNNAYKVSIYKNSKKKGVTNFSKGLIFEAKGRFGRKKTNLTHSVFFVDKALPDFLGWTSGIAKLRAGLRFYLMRLLSGWGSAGGLLLALLSANKDFLSSSVIDAFRKAGLAHVLALSGMHVSLVSLTAIQMGAIFGKKGIAMKFSLIFVIVFVWFAGSAPSLNRALGMMILIIIGKTLGLKPSMISILSAMLVFHIAVKPDDALSLGFMLSYGALAGILIFGRAVYDILNGKIPPKFLGNLSASVGAQTFTAPIVMFKIGVISPIGIIASVIVSPLISIFLILGLCAVFISLLFPFSSFIFSSLLNLIYDSIFKIIQIFSLFPFIKAKSFFDICFFSILPFCLGIICVLYSSWILKKREMILK